MTDELFAAVESTGLAVEANLASGYKQFLRALDLSSAYQALLAATKPSAGNALLLRLLKLLAPQAVPGHDHPHDTALAAYLRALSQADPEAARAAAGVVVRCEGCLWSRKVAEHLLAQEAAAA